MTWDPDSLGSKDQRRYVGSSPSEVYLRDEQRRRAALALAPPRPVVPANHVNVGDLWPGDVIECNGVEMEVERCRLRPVRWLEGRRHWELTVKGYGVARVGLSTDVKRVRRGPRPWDTSAVAS